MHKIGFIQYKLVLLYPLNTEKEFMRFIKKTKAVIFLFRICQVYLHIPIGIGKNMCLRQPAACIIVIPYQHIRIG